MSYLTSIDINKRLHEHLLHYINTYNRDWFVICAQGSMNYGIMKARQHKSQAEKLLQLRGLF